MSAMERFERILGEREVSRGRLSFDDGTATLSFPEADLELRFKSARDSPEATWRAGTLLVTASEIEVVDAGETFDLGLDEPVTIKLEGAPRPENWHDK